MMQEIKKEPNVLLNSIFLVNLNSKLNKIQTLAISSTQYKALIFLKETNYDCVS